ncbi:hypothetical protein ABPG75_011260 [Micractinium tetrahymenae]
MAPCSLLRLPDELLTAIIERVGKSEGPSVTLRVAGMVQVLQVHDGDVLEGIVGGGLTARFLRCLLPAAAREAQLECFSSTPLPAEAMAALASLTQLQRLELNSDELPANTTSTLCQLSASLRSLFLRADDIPLPLAETNSDDDTQLQPPPTTAFPALASFDYSTEEGTIKLVGCEVHTAQYENTACRPAGINEEGDENAAAQHTRDQTLHLNGVERPPTLRPLLDSLLSRCTPLRRLHLDLYTPVTAAAVAGCQHQFTTLTGLSLECRSEAATEGLPAVLQALAEQAPILAELHITRGLDGTFPAFLLQRTGLRELHLSFNSLAGLPPGPFLSGLQTLSMFGESLRRLPTSLAAATALSSLDLSQNVNLRLFAADMDAHVSPRLRNLSLTYCWLTLLPAFSQLSGLTSLNLAGNAFTSLPPALARATSLVCLNLSNMDSMALSTADVDALLARCPRLASLRLWCNGGRPAVCKRLLCIAPHLILD